MMGLVGSRLIMWSVAAATLPVLAACAYVYGAAVWQQFAAAAIAALVAEVLCLYWQKKSLRAAADGSACVAAAILAVALPPLAPWFVPAAAAAAAIMLAKHCYGGLGNNPFNPAMVGYVVVFFAFPQHFSDWHAVSTPTPLAAGAVANDGLIAAVAAVCGLLLIVRRFADWRLPLAFMLGAAAVAVYHQLAWRELLQSSLVFAAFFVVSDPVTAAASRQGRWLYGFLVGALAVWLRLHSVHTDGIAFAVLIGNIAAPLCDSMMDRVRQWRR